MSPVEMRISYYMVMLRHDSLLTKLIHRTWLLVNGNIEYVVQGKGRHPCYRVYKHDKEYTAVETAWIKYTWDGKVEKID